ncbi:MAG: hypothetical protein ACYC6N_23020 [Pirellulaceae bacterium]
MNSTNPEHALRENGGQYLVRDFVETREGLLFAVIASGLEEGRVLGFLRYVRREGTLRKLDTANANLLLQRQHVHYVYYSQQRDVALHGIPRDDVTRHYRPSARLAEIAQQPHSVGLEEKLCCLGGIIGGKAAAPSWLGVTGSLLIGSPRADSDIDLVCYGRDNFARARLRLRSAIDQGLLNKLPASLWRDAYQRRGCSLTFEEYVWHEQRKHTKFACDGTKVDISLIDAEPPEAVGCGKKRGHAVVRGLVTEDAYAFDYPACYSIEHPAIQAIVCYTPTYAGQAEAGEILEASGWVEETTEGRQRLVVGTSREAVGEYVKVLRTGAHFVPGA